MREMYRVVFALGVLFGSGVAIAQPPGYESFENGIPSYIKYDVSGRLFRACDARIIFIRHLLHAVGDPRENINLVGAKKDNPVQRGPLKELLT